MGGLLLVQFKFAQEVPKGDTCWGVSRLLQQATTMKYFGLCRLISAK